MRYLVFAPEQARYAVALLTKTLRKAELQDYVGGIERDIVAYSLPATPKPKNVEIKTYLNDLLPVLCRLQVDYVVVTDAAYFKVLTKVARVDRFYGYVLPCTLEGYEHLNVLYAPSPGAVLYDPTQKSKIGQAQRALQAHRTNTYVPPGASIIHTAHYPDSAEDIARWLEQLLDVELAIDIETYSLRHYDAGIGTITLCWNEHEGIAFCVDKDNAPGKARQIRALLKRFFEARIARTLYHRGTFDVYVLVYQLFMQDVFDTAGLLYGLEILLRNWDDTQLIRYFATNSCAGNKLSLKDVAQEFAGNYAVDVDDIRKVPKPVLLEYNLIDGLCTWYAYKKHYAQMVADGQLEVYETLFKPCVADIVQMQLTGLPLDMAEVQRGKAKMVADRDKALAIVLASPYVQRTEAVLAQLWADKRNGELKVKRVTAADWNETFNINSSLQLQLFLHDVMGLPVLERTATGQAATGMDSIEGLIHHATAPDQQAVLQALIDYKSVEKILTSFIPAFEQAYLAPDGWHYLFGFFNLGGTLSGRLSSSDPNLQNLPASGSPYRKLIKQMFRAPPGKLLVGLDFASLEDRISALTTKDPNKLKVYTDGYDGHSLRAYTYFRERMPDIDPTTVAGINAIQKKYPNDRFLSKAPTFALTYQGTWRTLVTNCGFEPELAKETERRYHELYVVSDQWVQAKLSQAAQVGYVTLAFGLRLRTPMMQQAVMNLRSTPYEAAAEGRSAGNALGQSYCLLNSRAGMAFMRQVRSSSQRLRIRPCAQIHDAQYYLIDDDPALVAWMNVHLVHHVQWQDLPEIQHPQVKLGGELSVFHPSWADEMTIPNGAGVSEILQLAKDHLAP